MIAHLLDGDLASNHLSWQWVAATFSAKPSLFNAENVARHAPAGWRVDGSALDTSYEALEAIARSQQMIEPVPALVGMPEPALLAEPPTAADRPDIAARQVTPDTLRQAARIRLVHPWMLADKHFDGLRLGVIHLPFHQTFPWSGLRWRFVMDRMLEVTDAFFIGDLNELKLMLPATAPVESIATLNPGYREGLASACGVLHEPARQFPNPAQACRSFSAFWSHCTGPEGAPRRSWHR